jgi:nucleoporin NUP159
MVVADKSSTDIEILGLSLGAWHQQWQENQLALPLDKTTSEDTVLLALDVDLTDPSGDGVPVMYAYLNDGTVEAWFVEGTKPYVGMIRPSHADTIASSSQPTATPVFTQQLAPASPFIQSTSTPAFGQSTFGSGGSAFGTTGFGQTSSPSTFGQQSTQGSAFGQQSQPLFGQTSQPKSGFGAFASSPSAFGGVSSASNTIGSFSGGSTFGTSSTTSAFGGTFGASSTPSAFGKPSSGGFGSFTPSGTNVFEQTSFGFGPGSSPANSPPPAPAPAVDMSREASMSDDTSFGGLSLGLGENNNNGSDGKDEQQKTGIFGSFSPPAAPTTTTFGGNGGGFLKPAAGFGAFSSYQSSGSGLGGNPTATTGSDQKPSSAFGQSSFGQSSFGKSGFGQSGFGQSGFGVKPAVPVPATTSAGGSGGGFSAFAASKDSSFGGSSGGAFGSGGGGAGAGFSAFTSSTPSAFGQQQQQTETSPFAPTSSVPVKSPFALPPTNTSTSPFGTQPQTSSSFRENSPIAKEDLTPKTPTKPLSIPPSPSSSPASSPYLGAIKPGTEGKPTSTPSTPFGSKFGGGAFGNITATPSAFKPASGFGAFGSDTTPTSSPFFKPKVNDIPTALTPISAFPTSSVKPQAQGQSSTATTTTTTTPTAAPAFGAPSSFGALKSAFTPPSPTPANTLSTGAFGAFSGSAGGFGAFAGQTKSFGELLRTGDGDKEVTGDPVKPSASVVFSTVKNEEKKEKAEEETKSVQEPKDTAKPANAESEMPATDAAAKSPTPEVVTPKITTKAMGDAESGKELPTADEERLGKGLFSSRTPVSTLPSVPSSTPAFDGGSEKAAATPKGKGVASPDSTPKAPVSVFFAPTQ